MLHLCWQFRSVIRQYVVYGWENKVCKVNSLQSRAKFCGLNENDDSRVDL